MGDGRTTTWFRLRLISAIRHLRLLPLRREPRRSTSFRAPEMPLPISVKRGLAGASSAVTLAYLAVLSASDPISVACGTIAAAFGAMSLITRHPRAIFAGSFVGVILVLFGEFLRVTYKPGAVEWLVMQLFTAVMLGTFAGSSVQEQVRFGLRILSRARTAIWLGTGAIGGLLLFSYTAPELLHPAIQDLAKGSAVLVLAVSTAGIMSLVALAIGVSIGRALRRFLCPALSSAEKEIWAQWEALYRP